MTDGELLRGLYFMLDDAEGLANDSGMTAAWWEQQMARCMAAGLTYRKPLGDSLVWDLTERGCELVRHQLWLEEKVAA